MNCWVCTVDAAVNPNGMSTLLANGVSTCLIIGKPTFIIGQEIYQDIDLIILF